MKKLLALFVFGGLLLAACSPAGGATAANVDGTDITVGQINDLIYVESGSVPKERFAEFLGYQIQWDILGSAVESEYGFVPSEEDVLAEADNIYESVPDKPADGTREEFLQNAGVTELFLQNIARQGLTDIFIREALTADAPEPAGEELNEARVVARASATQVCASHILVETEAEAQDAIDRLAAGEEFGELALEMSTDPTVSDNNGVLPCTTADTYVPAFRDAILIAPVGDVYEEVIESSFGFHAVLVTDRQDANEDDLPDDTALAAVINSQWVADELVAWFTSIMEAATVTVDPEFGTWSPNPPTVTPPQG